MKVRYRKAMGCYHNILFPHNHPMRRGKFPPDHPFSDNPRPVVMGKCVQTYCDRTEEIPGQRPVSDDALGRFRAAGYWASCFPEGDGICFDPLEGQTDERILADIENILGFEVVKP